MKLPIADLVKALKTDKNYRRSWVDNIAMAYKDNYYWYKRSQGKKYINAKDRHIIANLAANYFLDLLCKQKKG